MKQSIEIYFEERNFEILSSENGQLLKRVIELEHELNHLKIKHEQTKQRMISASVN